MHENCIRISLPGGGSAPARHCALTEY